MLNLWDPQHVSIGVGLITALILGMIHGVTPDEHTWPITFSYAIGSYSTKGGIRAGLFFSAAFMFQRMIASQLAYFSLTDFLMKPNEEMIIYLLVGLIMLLSGYYILYKQKTLHMFPWLQKLLPNLPEDGKPVPVKLALLHGFVAGWGTGAMATILYTVITPTMPHAWMGFIPGLLFGAGSTIMQILIGALFGRWMERKKIDQSAKQIMGRFVSGNTLLYGGALFMIVGILALAIPSINDWGISTGIRIHNLDSINIGLILVIVIVAGIGGWSVRRALRMVNTNI
ncbi:hypothetical protein LSG31_09120 [Fodinisporobacter ferrooxydans]|uniref:Urease accessory protein UreH-like transmembrane domain-containing protein n=1 Tax=Fodinisporobacter ferrooxydans TaxID=2901836 RepID=A0ABY4CS96_9BACL|nr:hypothetical protein LSG31_09120 [Alicyclobacillaceae bacterium MYW30-H2]